MRSPYLYLTSGQDEDVLAFVLGTAGVDTPRTSSYNTLAFYDARGLKFAAMYNQFVWPNIQMHVAARPKALWCRREIIFHCLAYPFIQLNCTRVTCPVLESNRACRRMVQALGFTLDGELQEAHKTGESIMLYGMLRRNCTWLNRPIKVEKELAYG